MPPCAVAVHVCKEEVPRRFEFLPDEPEAEHPAPEGVSFVLGLLGLGACEAYLLGKLAHGQAKLDHRLEVTRVEPVLLAVCRGIKLEKPEFNRVLREGRVEVEHVVPAVVVVVASSVLAMLAFVPDIRKLAHGRGFLPVDLFQESGVHRPAVSALPPGIHLDGFGNLALMARHDVHQVADGLGRVPLGPDVDVDSAAPSGVALHPGFPEGPHQPLQKLHVLVGQDRRDHFAFLVIRAADAYIPLELPFPALGIPGAPGHVAVPMRGVFAPASPKVGGGFLGSLLAGDVVALNLNPECLVLHVLDLDPRCFLHGSYLLCSVAFCFPFRYVHITVSAPQ